MIYADPPWRYSAKKVQGAAEHHYYDAVVYAYENGLMEGTGDTTFAPGMTTTRSMLATLL